MKYLILIFVISSMLLVSCKSQMTNYDDYKGKIMVVGKGGGFTGAYDEFSILENGQVYKYSTITKKRLLLGNMKKNFADQIFNNYELLKIGEKNINAPGNMNYFIEFKNGDNNLKSIWSDQKDESTSELMLYYKTVMNYISVSVEK
jgi:hypothetical protein